MHFPQNNLRLYILFGILIVLLSGYYGFHHTLLLEPQGSHIWRQSDCISVAQNYYQDGLNPFRPRMHNLLGGGEGHTLNEVPVLNYLAGVMFQLFHPNPFYFRILNLLLFILGIWSIFRIALLLLKDQFWPFIIAFLFYTVPLLLYYGNNFLPNVPAFGLALFGLYWMIKHWLEGKQLFLYLAFAFLIIAGLIKITAFIIGIAFVIFALTYYFGWVKTENLKFTKNKSLLMLAAVSLIILFSWYLFAIYYNQIHQTKYLTTSITPIWTLDSEGIQFTFDRIWNVWFEYFFYFPTIVVLVVLIPFVFYYRKHSDKLLFHLFWITFLGSFIYAILWFRQFIDHAYYTINLYMWIVLLVLNVFYILKVRFKSWFRSLPLKLIVLFFMILNVVYAKNRYWKQFENYEHEKPQAAFFDDGLKLYLKKVGVKKEDKVISLPDKSVNITLYFLDQPGWTEYNLHPWTSNDTISDFIEKGARYLIISDTNYLNKDDLQPYFKNHVGRFEDIHIFALPPELAK